MSEARWDTEGLLAVRRAVLTVMRSCFDPRAVERELETLQLLPAVSNELLSSAGSTPTAAVARVIRRAIEQLPVGERQAARIMTGVTKALPPSIQTTRADRTNAMAPYLTPAGRDGIGVSQRRVEMIEADILAPAVVEIILANTEESDVRGRPIFGHFVNPEILGLYRQARIEQDRDTRLARLDWATRVALLLSLKGLIFPASYVFEVPDFLDYLNESHEVVEAGLLRLTGPIQDLEDYRAVKSHEYRDSTSNPYLQNVDLDAVCLLPWEPRRGQTAGQSLGQYWSEAVLPGRDLWGVVSEISGGSDPAIRRRVQADLRAVPERLQGRAFIVRHAVAVLQTAPPPGSTGMIAWALSTQYVQSYLDDLGANIMVDFPWGRLNLSAGHQGREVSLQKLTTLLRTLGVSALLSKETSWKTLIEVSTSLEFDIVFHALYKSARRENWFALAKMDLSPVTNNNTSTPFLSRLREVIQAIA